MLVCVLSTNQPARRLELELKNIPVELPEPFALPQTTFSALSRDPAGVSRFLVIDDQARQRAIFWKLTELGGS